MFCVQMSENRPCYHMTWAATHIDKIKMAIKVRIQFYRFISQILLEYDPPMSKRCFEIHIMDLYPQTNVDKAVGE